MSEATETEEDLDGAPELDFGDLIAVIAEFMEDLVSGEDTKGRYTYWDVVHAMLFQLAEVTYHGQHTADGSPTGNSGSRGLKDKKLSLLLDRAILRLSELPVDRYWIRQNERAYFKSRA